MKQEIIELPDYNPGELTENEKYWTNWQNKLLKYYDEEREKRKYLFKSISDTFLYKNNRTFNKSFLIIKDKELFLGVRENTLIKVAHITDAKHFNSKEELKEFFNANLEEINSITLHPTYQYVEHSSYQGEEYRYWGGGSIS
jgi:hypothetical protein